MPARRIKARWSAFTDFDKNGCRWNAQKGGKHSRPYVWDFLSIATGQHHDDLSKVRGLVKIKDAAEIIGVTRHAIHEMIKKREIPVYKFGARSYRVSILDFQIPSNFDLFDPKKMYY